MLLVDSCNMFGEGVMWCDRMYVLYWVDIEGVWLWCCCVDGLDFV